MFLWHSQSVKHVWELWIASRYHGNDLRSRDEEVSMRSLLKQNKLPTVPKKRKRKLDGISQKEQSVPKEKFFLFECSWQQMEV